jgi:DNA-binding response OmpR family regulator
MRLLVVEDDPLLAEGLMRTLARAGHAVEHASGGRHASTLLAGRNYDLVVLDIGLPDIDGFEVPPRNIWAMYDEALTYSRRYAQ